MLRVCMGHLQPFLFLLPALHTGRGTAVESPTSLSPSVSNLYRPMHIPPIPLPNFNILIISYLWNTHPFPHILSQEYARKCKSPDMENLGIWCGPVSVILEFDDKLWLALISPWQFRPIQLSKSQPKIFRHGCAAVHCQRHMVPDLRSTIFRYFFNWSWKLLLCMWFGHPK